MRELWVGDASLCPRMADGVLGGNQRMWASHGASTDRNPNSSWSPSMLCAQGQVTAAWHWSAQPRGLGGSREEQRAPHTHRGAPTGVGASMQTLLRAPGASTFRKTRCKHLRSPHTQEPHHVCSFSIWTPRTRTALSLESTDATVSYWAVVETSNVTVKLPARWEGRAGRPPATRTSPSCSILRLSWLPTTVAEGTTCDGRR